MLSCGSLFGNLHIGNGKRPVSSYTAHAELSPSTKLSSCALASVDRKVASRWSDLAELCAAAIREGNWDLPEDNDFEYLPSDMDAQIEDVHTTLLALERELAGTAEVTFFAGRRYFPVFIIFSV